MPRYWWIPYVVLCGWFFTITHGNCDIRYSQQWQGTEFNCHQKSLLTIPSFAPMDITSLQLRDNHIQRIQRSELKFADLRYLDVSFNNLTFLQKATFSHLVNLLYLDLRYNSLTNHEWSLPPGILYGLEKLTNLNLNQCTSDKRSLLGPAYPENIFSHVPNLVELNFGCLTGTMRSVPEAIARLPRLKIISIGYGTIALINGSSLNSLRNSSVETLRIASQGLFHLDEDTFSDIPSLKGLQLPKTALSNLTNVFGVLGSTLLTDVVLDLSYPDHIPSNVICNSLGQSVKRLSLLNLRSAVIDLDIFKCFERLEVLSMRHCSFHRISFRGQPFSDFIKGKNPHRVVPPTLRIFDLSYYLTLPDEYHLFVRCTRQHQAPCYYEFENYFPHNPISYNITLNTTDIVRNSVFSFLSVTNMNFRCVRPKRPTPYTTFAPIRLDAADFSYATLLNCMGRLIAPKMCLGDLESLQYLDISHVGFTSLPCLMDVRNLRILNVSFNRLGHLEKWKLEDEFFWGLPLLEVLDLSYNFIITVPRDILLLHPMLSVLDLSGNLLEPITMLFHIPVENNIRLLNLSFNRFSYLSTESIVEFKHMSSASGIDLQGNPYICVCALKETAEWIKTTLINIHYKDTLVCSHDEPYVHLSDINISSLCSYNNVTIGLIAGFGTLLLCLLVTGAFFKYRMNIVLSYYVLKWKLNRRWSHDSEGSKQFDAYVVYNNNSNMDRHFVTQTVIDLVETKYNHKLFIWDRNSLVGTTMAEEIVTGMMSCKKIIIIHSKDLFPVNDANDAVDLALLGGEREEEINGANLNTGTADGVDNNMTGEWVDFTILTVMRFIKYKEICVIRRGEISTKDVAPKWHPLLFPNIYFSPIVILKVESSQFEVALQQFVMS